MENLYKSEQELGIDYNKPLEEQNPIDKLNDLERKKRKHADDIHDYFRSTKRYKSSIQYEDHLAGTVLNEPCLGMIMINSYQRQDFVTIEDFGDFTNEMLYIVQEIFFRLHQGPGLDDHARTFSSFLLAKKALARASVQLVLGLKRLHGFLEVTAAQVRNRSRFGINKWYQSLAFRNFDLEDMELESTNSGPTTKFPILKLVIENGDSWVSISQTTEENRITTSKMSTPATAEERTKKKNDVKARGLLLIALPNEHQLTFSQYLDAKSMFAAIKTRFGESLDSIFNRLQKIVSRLAILGVIIAQEDLNLNFLSSLPPEWNTHVVVWTNKPQIETISIDDLYNNFKIIEQKIKKTVGTSSGGQNLAFMSTPNSSSTNDANTAYSQVSATSPSVNTASPQVCTASVSDNTVYAFMVENLNGSNVLHQDLEQIHEDDLEAMDLKWQLSLLSVRAKKYYQKTGKKIFINGNDIAGYDKSKVECYNCHKLGHFARECRASRSKEDQFRNQDNTRKQGNKEDTSKAMLAIDGVGFDWSDMPEEQVHINMALMTFSDSEVYTDKTCSKTCLNNYETLKKQYDDLLAKQLQTKFEASTYKRGLDIVEAQLVTYRKNEVLFSEEVVVLKREVGIKQYEINTLKTEFEKLKQEKDGIEFKIEKFDKASKDLDQLLESQITNKSKKGLGYSAVPPPHPLIYNRPNKLDLSYSGLDEFKEPEFKGYGPENSKKESNVVCEKESDNSKENSNKSLVKEQESQVKSSFVEGCGSNTSKNVSEVEPKKVRKNNDAPIIEDWVSDDEEQDESMTKPEKKTVIPTAAKIEKTVKKSVRVDNYYYAKTSHHRTHKNVTPRAVLLRTGLKPLSTAKSVYTAHPKPTVHCARPKTHFFKSAQSTVQRPFYKNPALTNRHFNHKVNTVRPRIVNTARSYRTPVNTVRPRVVNTARQNRTSVNAARANGFNVGKPQHDDKGFVDSGCSRHMTDNLRNRSRIGINKWYQSFALRNFDLEDMKLEYTNSGTTTKLPILKLDEYEMWVIRIKQYFQIQDYALWEVIENGDSWVSVPQTAQENESLDSIFNRDHKIANRLAILGVVIAQEDLNSEFLSSLPPEWNTHVVVWMNKPEVKTMSINDLYNNFKIVEQKLPMKLTLIVHKFVLLAICYAASPPVYIPACEQIHENDLEQCIEVAALFATCEGKEVLRKAKKECRALKCKEGQLKIKTTPGSKQTMKRNLQGKLSEVIKTEFQQLLINGFKKTERYLITYRKNEVFFSEEVVILKREVACKDYEINVLKSEFEKVKQEKDGIEFKIEKFDKALKDLDQLLGIQITDKNKKGLGYSAVPPPHTLIYNRPKKLDLSYYGLDEFKEPEFKGRKTVSQDTSSFVESLPNVDKETIFPVNKKAKFAKPKNHEKPVKKSVRPVNSAHPKSVVPSAKSILHYSKQAQSTTRIPFYKQTTLTRRFVHTAKRHYYTKRPRAVNIARSYTRQVNTIREKGVNAAKTSACWVWRPTKPNGASLAFKRHNYIDVRGRS
ncbi:ribonuclease H-like domain-containing protein, partial [Tanacetum coccineum]